MVRSCGAALGFMAFAIAIFLGIIAGNSAEETLVRAIWALVLFFLLGLLVGWIAYRIVDEHAIHQHKEMFGPLAETPETADGPPPRGSDNMQNNSSAGQDSPKGGPVTTARP